MFKILVLLAFINIGIYEAARTTSHTKKTQTTSTIPPQNPSVGKHNYTVIKVADGDTITVRNNTDKNLVRVRFLCIDAPEKSQPKWGAESLKKLAELLPLNSEIKLAGEKIDLYGRTVAEVINKQGVNVNRQMVDLGLVVFYPFQKGCNDYKFAESVAKTAKKGVWSDNSFELPWEYRTRMGIGARGQASSTETTRKGTTKLDNKHHSSTLTSKKSTEPTATTKNEKSSKAKN